MQAANQSSYDPAYILLYSEINIICILFQVIILIRSRSEMQNADLRRRMAAMLAASSVYDAADTVWFLIYFGSPDHGGQGAALLYFLKSPYFLFSAVTSYEAFRYLIVIQRRKLAKNRKAMLVLSLPVLVLFVLLLINLKSGILFSYDPSTLTYARGPYFRAIYYCSYVYFLEMFGTTIARLFMRRYYTQRELLRGILGFIIPPAIAALLQLYLRRIPLLCIGLTTGLWIQYMNQLKLMISRDLLTSLHNRRQLIRDLQHQLSVHGRDGSVHLYMIDIDYFKEINDRYGHAKGDEALCLLADLMRKIKAQVPCEHMYLSRYGGDEFVIVAIRNAGFSAQAVPESLSAQTEDLLIPGTDMHLQLSVGRADNRQASTVQDLLQLADQDMYRAKKAHHAVRRRLI